MRRITIAAMIALVALAGNSCAGTISKGKSKKVVSYFAKALQGTRTDYEGNEKIKDIEATRSAVWECWREAVNGLNEEKLNAPFATTEPRDTGYWRLPQELEADALMPYYFIKKGEQPGNGYPLFLYMHGSGEKNREWEAGIRLCSSYDDAPSLHFIPQIPNGYGELYRWAIQSKQWAWEKLLQIGRAHV